MIFFFIENIKVCKYDRAMMLFKWHALNAMLLDWTYQTMPYKRPERYKYYISVLFFFTEPKYWKNRGNFSLFWEFSYGNYF